MVGETAVVAALSKLPSECVEQVSDDVLDNARGRILARDNPSSLLSLNRLTDTEVIEGSRETSVDPFSDVTVEPVLELPAERRRSLAGRLLEEHLVGELGTDDGERLNEAELHTIGLDSEKYDENTLLVTELRFFFGDLSIWS
jgi:hypothetical protein